MELVVTTLIKIRITIKIKNNGVKPFPNVQ